MSVFRFENTAAFQWLWMVPILVGRALFFTYSHRKRMKNFFSAKLYPFLSSSVSIQRRNWKLFLECLVVILFIFALIRITFVDVGVTVVYNIC